MKLFGMTWRANPQNIDVDMKKFKVVVENKDKSEWKAFASKVRKEAIDIVPIVATRQKIHQGSECIIFEVETKPTWMSC